jgi:vacuolar-type H+-ATPase subunit I/STV1
VAALPFFGWTLLGDMTYGAVFFGLHAWLSRSVAVRERVAA